MLSEKPKREQKEKLTACILVFLLLLTIIQLVNAHSLRYFVKGLGALWLVSLAIVVYITDLKNK